MQLKNFENPKMCVEFSQIDIEPQRITDLPLNATVVHRVLLDKVTSGFVGTGVGLPRLYIIIVWAGRRNMSLQSVVDHFLPHTPVTLIILLYCMCSVIKYILTH